MKEGLALKEVITDRDIQIDKSKSLLERAKEQTELTAVANNELKTAVERFRKQAQAQKDKLELDINDLRSQLKLRDNKLITADEEIAVLRDQSGGATKALSQEKKRLEEVEDNLQTALTAGRQRETALKSQIEAKAEDINKLERKTAEMVRRLHQFDLEKDETREREERLNSLLSEGSEQHGALQGEMESLKSQYDRRLRLAEENRRENESSISLLEKDMEG